MLELKKITKIYDTEIAKEQLIHIQSYQKNN